MVTVEAGVTAEVGVTVVDGVVTHVVTLDSATVTTTHTLMVVLAAVAAVLAADATKRIMERPKAAPLLLFEK